MAVHSGVRASSPVGRNIKPQIPKFIQIPNANIQTPVDVDLQSWTLYLFFWSLFMNCNALVGMVCVNSDFTNI
jgi:hypothetical protein